MASLTRRALLRRAASLGVVLAAAPGEIFAQTQDGDLEDLVKDLAERKLGHVLRAGDAEHRKVTYYNGRFDCLRAKAVIRPTSAEGVRAAVAWAKQHRRPFAIRGAGHSFEGKSSHGDLVIDMSQMRAMSFEDGILVVEAGVQLGDVYKVIGPQGFVLAGGTCPTVGLVGHTLGGGIGDFLPMFGYAAQSLRSVQLVSMDGALLQVSDGAIEMLDGAPLPDGVSAASLMRALRGGGQGSFGIVTRMQFQASDVRTSKMASFHLQGADNVSQKRAVEILRAWFAWREDLATPLKELTSAKLNLSRSGGGFSFDISGLAVIPDGAEATLDEVRRTLDPLFKMAEFSGKSFERDLTAVQAIKSFLDDDETTYNPKRKMLYGSSSVLSKALPEAAIRHLLQNLRSAVFASFYTSGGRANAGPETSLHPSQFLIEWSTYSPRRDSTANRRIRELAKAVMTLAGDTDAAFPNYPDSDARAYFPERTALDALRALLDPNGLSTSSLLTASTPRDSACR